MHGTYDPKKGGKAVNPSSAGKSPQNLSGRRDTPRCRDRPAPVNRRR